MNLIDLMAVVILELFFHRVLLTTFLDLFNFLFKICSDMLCVLE